MLGMIVLVVPAVKAATVGRAFDWGLGFVKSNFDSNLLWLVGGIGFFVWLAFRKRKGGGSVGSTKELRYLGDRGERDRQRWALNKAKDDRKKEANQLKIDGRIDNAVSGLRWTEARLDREQINLDKDLYGLRDHAKRLSYWEKRIGPYLKGVLNEINKIIKQIRKGKLNDLDGAKQSLRQLYDKYMVISDKHHMLLERFRQLIRRERGLIETKLGEEKKEEYVIAEEITDEKVELRNIKRELNEALDELKQLRKQPNVSRKEIRMQRKKIRDIIEKRDAAKKELRTEGNEAFILKRVEGLEKSIVRDLDMQEESIENMERIEGELRKTNLHPGKTKELENGLEKELRLMKTHAVHANIGIAQLKSMDKRKSKLELRANRLRRRGRRESNDEERILTFQGSNN